MTQDEIIEMAKQSGLLEMDYELGDWEIHEFTTFAELVASAAIAKEREGLVRMIEANILDERNACAELVESFQRDFIYTADLAGHIAAIKRKLAEAIRARGQ